MSNSGQTSVNRTVGNGTCRVANQLPLVVFSPCQTSSNPQMEKYIPNLTVGRGSSSQSLVEHKVALGSSESAAGSSVKQSWKNHRSFIETVDVSLWINRKGEKKKVEATAVSYMVFAQSPVRDSPYRSAEVAQRQLANERASWHRRCEHQYHWVGDGYPHLLPERIHRDLGH